MTTSGRRPGRDFYLDRFGLSGRGARRINGNFSRLFMKVKRALVDTPPDMDFELTRSPSHIGTAFDMLSFIQSCLIPVSIQPVYDRHCPVSLAPRPLPNRVGDVWGYLQSMAPRAAIRFTHGSRTSTAYS